MKGKILLVGLFALAVVLSGCVEPVACTEEAKMCPDGTFVGRNPALNCEFDSCPAATCDRSCSADSDCTFTCEIGNCVNKDDFDCLGTEISCTLPPGECKCVENTCEFEETVGCKGEGETIPVIAEPSECCPGLTLIPPKEADLVGISGYCTAECGNGTCDTATESTYNCPQDCDEGGGPLYQCGDGECQDWELTETHPGYCPEDCDEPIDVCEENRQFAESISSDPMCAGQDFICVDGWETIAYYDNGLTDTVQSGNQLGATDTPQDIQDATVATYSKSSCSCEKPVSYEIREGDVLVDADCESFVSFITDYFNDCQGCLLNWTTGCC